MIPLILVHSAHAPARLSPFVALRCCQNDMSSSPADIDVLDAELLRPQAATPARHSEMMSGGWVRGTRRGFLITRCRSSMRKGCRKEEAGMREQRGTDACAVSGRSMLLGPDGLHAKVACLPIFGLLYRMQSGVQRRCHLGDEVLDACLLALLLQHLYKQQAPCTRHVCMCTHILQDLQQPKPRCQSGVCRGRW